MPDKVSHFQVNTLPASPIGNALYFVKNGAAARAYATDGAGTAFEISPNVALTVINDLTSTSTTDPVAAAQTTILKGLIDLNTAGLADRGRFTDVVNNLTSTDTDKPASAATVKSLKAMIDGLNADGHVTTIGWDLATRTITVTDEDGTQNAFVIPDQVLDVVATITSTDDTKALAASQGKVLNDKITAENQWLATEW